MARSLFVLSAAAALLLACAAAVSAADVEAKLLGDFLLQGDKGSNAKVKVASAGYKDKDYKDKEHKSDYKANDYPDEYKGKGYRHHTVNLALINFKNCAVYVSGASYVE
jgi:opacity protein-like surface antigen